MKTFYLLLTIGLGINAASAQNITFNGCHNLFDDQNYVLINTGTDTFNKKIYITTPVDGNQACGGLGTCEFKIQWNNTLTRWEFLADSGNGDFVDPYLIFYNSTGNNAATNPPSNSVGTWVENTAVTENACGGNLSSSNSTMTGDVHNSTLAVHDLSSGKIQLFPNPVADFITIQGVEEAQNVVITNAVGQQILKTDFKNQLNVSQLQKGIYFLKIFDSKGKTYNVKFIKK